MVFLINYKIVYGPNAKYNDGIDFIKKNKKLFRSLMKGIAGLIIKILVVIALKNIAELVAAAVAKRQIEKSKSSLTQMLSLIGITQETLRLIKGLT